MPELDRLRWRLRRRLPGFSRPDVAPHYPPDVELEPTHVDIDLFVDLAARRASGTVTTTVRARHAGPRRLTLDAVDLELDAVVDADGHALSWRYDGERLEVTWADALGAGEQRRLAVTYQVEAPITGLYFSQPDDVDPGAPWLAATDHETERARYWLPCVDHPSVRPHLDFRLRAEERYTILANGALVGQTSHDDGTKTAQWRLDAPCPSYLTCFVIGELTRADDGEVAGVPIAYFAPARYSPDDLRRSFGRTGDMLAWLNDKLGTPLPYPKYFQFAAPGIGGAMENISLVSWDERFMLDEELAREWTWLLDVINVHEMAHSWFGDWIVCRDYAHAWLKEGWATYVETCWLEHAHGDDESRYNRYADAQRYFNESDQRYRRPIVTRVFEHSWDMYDMHLYPGAAWRLHMLRQTLGDETFWAAVRDYVARYGGQVVETDDFRRVLEEHSGRSLGLFFDQWLHRPGHPKLKVTFAHDAEKGQGRFEIAQTQVEKAASGGASASKNETEDAPDVPVFHFDLELGWSAGGEHHLETVAVTRSEHTVVVPMSEAPERVRIDPAGKVLHQLDFDPGDDLLLRQLTQSPDVVGRIQAGETLAKKARDKHIDAVADAYRAETFWGVRVELARALTSAGTHRAVGALADLLRTETDPMVMEPLFRSAGAFRDPRVKDALSARLDADLPPRARAAALESLGKQRSAAPVEVLLAESKRRTLHGFVESGAFNGLAEARHRDGLERLLDATQRGSAHDNARWAAALGLGRLGGLQERGDRERVVERLVDLLRDPNERVRSSATRALFAMHAAEASPALQAYADRTPAHEATEVRRGLRALRQADKPREAALQKQVESLEDRLRKIEKLVRRLEADAAAEPGSPSGDSAQEEPKPSKKRSRKKKKRKQG